MIDDVASFVAAAEVLNERGAYKIYVLATHGILSSDAPQLLEASPIDEVCCMASMASHTLTLLLPLNNRTSVYRFRLSLRIRCLTKCRKCSVIKSRRWIFPFCYQKPSGGFIIKSRCRICSEMSHLKIKEGFFRSKTWRSRITFARNEEALY